jgi:hypothetical protein
VEGDFESRNLSSGGRNGVSERTKLFSNTAEVFRVGIIFSPVRGEIM